jgi:hypothetical protein
MSWSSLVVILGYQAESPRYTHLNLEAPPPKTGRMGDISTVGRISGSERVKASHEKSLKRVISHTLKMSSSGPNTILGLIIVAFGHADKAASSPRALVLA